MYRSRHTCRSLRSIAVKPRVQVELSLSRAKKDIQCLVQTEPGWIKWNNIWTDTFKCIKTCVRGSFHKNPFASLTRRVIQSFPQSHCSQYVFKTLSVWLLLNKKIVYFVKRFAAAHGTSGQVWTLFRFESEIFWQVVQVSCVWVAGWTNHERGVLCEKIVNVYVPTRFWGFPLKLTTLFKGWCKQRQCWTTVYS